MGNGLLGFVAPILISLSLLFIGLAIKAVENADGHKASQWSSIAFFSLGVCALLWAVKGDGTMVQKNFMLGVIGAAFGASTFIFIGYALGDSPIPPDKTNPENTMADKVTQNVTSYNQQGGITAGTVSVAPQRLVFSPEVGAQLLAAMPVKKKVNLTSIGGGADQAVGDQVESFLVANGYKVDRTITGVQAPPPDHKVSFGETADAYILVLAPSLN